MDIPGKHDQIISYFNGQLSPEGEAEILDWIKESKENLSSFLEIKETLDPEKITHPLFAGSYAELQNKLLINQQFHLGAGKHRRLQLSYPLVAAILILAVILGFAVASLVTGNMAARPKVVWFETKVSRGQKSQLQLPDGSRVWMNSESSLSYPSNFMEGNRQVKLKGEAYFEVAKLHGSAFTVEVPDYDVRVLGTRFNVMAYADFNRTETTLIEGKVEILRGDQVYAVKPGEIFTYKDHQCLTKKTDPLVSAKWKDGIFDFDRITFRELVVRLERWYDVDIEIESPELNNTIYSGVFKNEETIMQVLNTLELTLPVHYTRTDFRKFSIEINK